MADQFPVEENPENRCSESEETLLEKARGALSNCNWIVGECAALWTDRYARGRTDAEFGALVGLTSDQVFQRRRVWQTFHDVKDLYAGLKWSHFYVALNWDDASECLSWARENQATVSEMRAWRRSIHGEDLTLEPDSMVLQALDYDNTPVRGTQEGSFEHEDVPFEPNTSGSSAGTLAEATPYAPFRKDARGAAFEPGEAVAQGTVVRPDSAELSPLRIVKRAIGGMKRLQSQLAELSDDDFQSLTPDVINQLWDAYDDLGREIKRQN
ncbi:MAG: hypothetical protein KDA66_11560 [Planctomycetaceae bacterium]|nr:hypothetical protein [Planctomycetaceae bacterium]MCA9031439.1 hypothetical protein [Planctomycetaceae bacterium]